MSTECLMHHHACNCREADYAAIKKERDELRAMIEGAHHGVISNRRSSGTPDCIVIHGDLPSDSWGKKVLVVLEHRAEVSDV